MTRTLRTDRRVALILDRTNEVALHQIVDAYRSIFTELPVAPKVAHFDRAIGYLDGAERTLYANDVSGSSLSIAEQAGRVMGAHIANEALIAAALYLGYEVDHRMVGSFKLNLSPDHYLYKFRDVLCQGIQQDCNRFGAEQIWDMAAPVIGSLRRAYVMGLFKYGGSLDQSRFVDVSLLPYEHRLRVHQKHHSMNEFYAHWRILSVDSTLLERSGYRGNADNLEDG